METARWAEPDGRSPWRAFVAVSVGVHLAAVALVALALLLLEVPSAGRAGARARPVVSVALLEPATPTVPLSGEPLPSAAGSAVPGIDDAASLALTEPGVVPPAGPVPPPSLRPRAASGAASGPRVPGGGPARTVVTMAALDGELEPGAAGSTVTAGSGDEEGAKPAVAPGDGGPDPAGGGPAELVLGPPGSPMTVSLGSLDPRYSDYLGTVAALLEREWRDAFPRDRALFMQQGEIVLAWTIRSDGSIAGPSVVRASGVPPFDRNVLQGFRRAAERFPRPPGTMPLPVRVLAPFRFANPMFD
ncbi:MAG: TonB C-terminal domain-containing protein [Deltaproteobacteria bacterium]|nr:TonB C-terminal domain-containing protein [Deltaproteobacteria bacterium]